MLTFIYGNCSGSGQQLWQTTMPDSAVTIGLVTALPIESAAMRLMVDDCRDHRVVGDSNRYQLATVPSTTAGSPHRVVLTVLPADGTRNAAAICADLLRSFPSIRVIVMVGIAGGVPEPIHSEIRIKVGDVVSATGGIVDYDHVRTVDGTSRLRRHVEGISTTLLRADNELQVKERSHTPFPWARWLNRPGVTEAFAAPPNGRYGVGGSVPTVHRGVIGSADRIVRDAVLRDHLNQHFRILAVEMEASGVAVGAALHETSWFVVRGIADLADGSKDDAYHPYAALVAAIYTRALLAECHPMAPAPKGDLVPAARRSLDDRHDALLEISAALGAIDQLQNPDDRQAFLAALPRRVSGAIPYSARSAIHLQWVVRTCAETVGGLEMLLRALASTVPESSIGRQRVEALIESVLVGERE